MAIGSGKNFPRIGEVISVEGTFDPEVVAQLLAPYEQYRDPATGLYHIPVPESEEEELARLRAEVARLREALIAERFARIRHTASVTVWREDARDELIAEGLLPPAE